MKISRKYVNNDTLGFEYLTVNYQYLNDKKIIDNIIEKTKDISQRISPFSSGGYRRNNKTIINRLAGGLLVENAYKVLLEKYSQRIRKNLIIFNSNNDNKNNQVDIEISVNNKNLKLECRSSYVPENENVDIFFKKYSLIGWYSSYNKPMEEIKDYYLGAFHQYKMSETIELMYSEIEIILTAGASKVFMEKNGKWNNLNQPGAKFKIIRPMIDACTIQKILDEIFEL